MKTLNKILEVYYINCFNNQIDTIETWNVKSINEIDTIVNQVYTEQLEDLTSINRLKFLNFQINKFISFGYEESVFENLLQDIDKSLIMSFRKEEKIKEYFKRFLNIQFEITNRLVEEEKAFFQYVEEKEEKKEEMKTYTLTELKQHIQNIEANRSQEERERIEKLTKEIRQDDFEEYQEEEEEEEEELKEITKKEAKEILEDYKEDIKEEVKEEVNYKFSEIEEDLMKEQYQHIVDIIEDMKNTNYNSYPSFYIEDLKKIEKDLKKDYEEAKKDEDLWTDKLIRKYIRKVIKIEIENNYL